MPESNGSNGLRMKWLIPLLLAVLGAGLGAGKWIGSMDLGTQTLYDALQDLRREGQEARRAIRQDLSKMDDKLDSALERLARLEGRAQSLPTAPP